MAKWKPVRLDGDILCEGEGELIGIEELVCPDDCDIVYGGPNAKEGVKDSKKHVREKKLKKKKEKKIKPVVIKENVTFQSFSHHDKMLAWNGFGLREEILASLYDKEFFQPTDIQMKSLGPAVCGYRDILGAAETGSGKTLAFGIPIINGILNLKSRDNMEGSEDFEECSADEHSEYRQCNVDQNNQKTLKSKKKEGKLFALILTPTRELAVQVKNHLADICKYTDIKIVLIVGGLAQEKQERLLRKGPEIIVATPGRLWDLIQFKNPYLKDINKIRYLAIDETDRMLEKGHFEELTNLLECINFNEHNKKKRQNFVFSATLTLVHDPPSYVKAENKQRITPGQKLQQLITRIGITNAKIVDITSSQITPENLSEYRVVCKFEEKDYYLHYFLKNMSGKTIIFCNSIGCVKRLANLLNILNYSPLPLHANMMQRQRLKNLEKFRDQENSILIATDVAARGLDISNVNHVLHYQVPKTAEVYIHRSGRTARKNNVGNVLLLIEPQEYKFYNKLIHTLGRDNEIEDLQIDNHTLSCSQKVIHLARDIDQLMLAVKRQNSTNNWYSKTISDLDIVLDEDDLPKKVSNEANRKIKLDLDIKRKKLKQLLEKPNVSKNYFGKFPKPEVTKTLLISKHKPSKGNVTLFKKK